MKHAFVKKNVISEMNGFFLNYYGEFSWDRLAAFKDPFRVFRGSLGQRDRRTDPLMHEAMGRQTYPFRKIYEAHLRMIVFQ